MKIDLSKYPPGTKFKLKNGETVVLVSKSQISNDYLVESIRDEYLPSYPAVTYRTQDGIAAIEKYNIESVIQPDKYLVFYLTKSKEFKTEIILAPSVLTAETFLNAVIILNSPKWECFGDDSEYPVKILSWSKIEE